MLAHLIRGLAALLALLGPVSFAHAQTLIPVELDAPFVHEGSGITIDPRIGRFERTSVQDFTTEQLNIAIQLREESKDTFVTLYIYRAATPNVSIWGDFASIAMTNNPSIGEVVSGTFFLGRFTPPNAAGPNSALHARALVKGTNERATGLSVFAHNDWIVKVRATSKVLSDEEITAVIGKVISGLEMEASATTYPPVTLVQSCKKPMKFGKKPSLKAFDLVGQIVVGTSLMEVSVSREAADSPTSVWCRDEQSTSEHGIYRKDNAKSAYFVALSDSGTGAYVSNARRVSSVSGYLVKSSDGLTEAVWPLFDKRPHPALIRSMYGSVSPITTQDVRPGSQGGSNLRVTMPDE